MKILLHLAQAAGLSLALTAAAFADEPLKIATSAGPVGQLASYAAKLAKEKGLDVKTRRVERLGCAERGGQQRRCRRQSVSARDLSGASEQAARIQPRSDRQGRRDRAGRTVLEENQEPGRNQVR